MTKVLIVSHDSTVRKFSDLALKNNGFVTHTVTHSAAAWRLLQEINFDLIMIDFQLRNESGLALYKSIRQVCTQIPVLMMGQGAFDEFMLKDLSPSAYDYILKPFKFRELRMKIIGLLYITPVDEDLIIYGEMKIDVKKRLVMVKDRFLQLGRMEFKILMLLARKTGEVVDPKKIKSIIQAEGNMYQMTAFYYINRLRKKLHDLADGALEINLIRGQGYRLELGGKA